MQLLDRLLVESKILLATDEDDGKALAKVKDFGDPLYKSTQVSTLCQIRCNAVSRRIEWLESGQGV